MTPPVPPPAPGWVLHVQRHLGCSSTLVYTFEDGSECRVSLTPAHTSLLLALAACRALDLRDGVTEKVGYRSLEHLGRTLRAMPGPGNPITAEAVGGYKRKISRLVKAALAELSRSRGEPLHAPMPILHRGYGQGYCLGDDGLPLVGVSLADLEKAARTVAAP